MKSELKETGNDIISSFQATLGIELQTEYITE